MRSNAGFLAVVLLSCSGSEVVDPTGAPSQVRGEPAARSGIERDLVLTLKRPPGEPFDPGGDPHVQVVMENHSATRPYAVVLSNDGSEAGWREPHAWFTVERRMSPTGPWEPTPETQGLRCGNYATDWERDVVTLAPGASVAMPWFPFGALWEFGDATHVRVTAHYVYGEIARDPKKIPPALHATPPFTLQSAPLELVVDPPLALEVTVRGPIPRGPGTTIASAFSVMLVNRRSAPQKYALPAEGAVLRLELDVPEMAAEGAAPSIELGGSTGEAQATLAASGRQELVAPRAVTRPHFEVRPANRVRRVRARYSFESNGESRHVESRWVDVKE